MTRLLMVVMVAAALAGCSRDRGVVDGGVSILQPTIVGDDGLAGFKGYGPSAWPVKVDGYGTESPQAPPNECDCPPGFAPSYNGHNWVCRNGTDATFPQKNAWCSMPRARQ